MHLDPVIGCRLGSMPHWGLEAQRRWDDLGGWR